MSRPGQLADVACCILRGADLVLGNFGYLPTYRYVAPKGMDAECCSSLVVVPASSEPASILFPNEPRCARMRTYRFAVELGVCVNENLTCRDVGDCCEVPARWNPCERPAPSKSAEARFLLDLRWTIERELPEAVRCCLGESVTCSGDPSPIACRAIDMQEVTSITEGSCHYLIAVLALTM